MHPTKVAKVGLTVFVKHDHDELFQAGQVLPGKLLVFDLSIEAGQVAGLTSTMSAHVGHTCNCQPVKAVISKHPRVTYTLAARNSSNRS